LEIRGKPQPTLTAHEPRGVKYVSCFKKWGKGNQKKNGEKIHFSGQKGNSKKAKL